METVKSVSQSIMTKVDLFPETDDYACSDTSEILKFLRFVYEYPAFRLTVFQFEMSLNPWKFHS